MSNIILPTFDEWYASKCGHTFESGWMRNGMQIEAAMRALSECMRDYVSDLLVTAMHSKDDQKTPADRQGFEPFELTERN